MSSALFHYPIDAGLPLPIPTLFKGIEPFDLVHQDSRHPQQHDEETARDDDVPADRKLHHRRLFVGGRRGHDRRRRVADAVWKQTLKLKTNLRCSLEG